jgi:hypothetical protein
LEKQKTGKSTKKEQPIKAAIEPTEMDVVENERTEKSEQKSLANTSIFAEMMALAEDSEEEISSPFPIFRDEPENKFTGEPNKESIQKNEGEHKAEKVVGGDADKGIRVDVNQEKTPFPVFHSERDGGVKVPEKTMQKEAQTTEPKRAQEYVAMEERNLLQEKAELVQPEISDENKARIAVNVTMRAEEIQAIAEQLKSAAKFEMEMAEKEWSKQVPVGQGGRERQPSAKEITPSSHQGGVVQGIKK